MPPLFSVAPMMACTDRHARFLYRQLSRRAGLWTEMLHARAVLEAPGRHLAFDPVEHPVGAQLGGNDPVLLGEAALCVEAAGFDEVNLNLGCPSERVRAGAFGAALMLDPPRAAACAAALVEAVRIPVSAKIRIGVDGRDRFEDLLAFVDRLADAGVTRFAVHARKAWLTGLNPRENRTVPPLRHDVVVRLARARPRLEIILNGGITRLEEAQARAPELAGVMMGRGAYHDPWCLTGVDEALFGDRSPPGGRPPTRAHALLAYRSHVERALGEGVSPPVLAKPALGLLKGIRGGRALRRRLGQARDPGALLAAIDEVARVLGDGEEEGVPEAEEEVSA